MIIINNKKGKQPVRRKPVKKQKETKTKLNCLVEMLRLRTTHHVGAEPGGELEHCNTQQVKYV
jgi:hypothetical protein